MKNVPIASIRFAAADFRQNLGDLSALKRSLCDHGMLHPVVIDQDGELVAGRRRLAAAKDLGWSKIPARVVDVSDLLAAALDENLCREPFLPSEVWALTKRMKSPRGRPRCGQQPAGKTSEKIARYFRMSPRKVEMIGAVVESGHEDLIADMDKGRSAAKVYNALRRREKDESRKSLPAPPTEGYPIHHCDFRELKVEEYASLIVSDPPWGREGLALIEPFVEWADRVLAPDGIIVLYPGKLFFREWGNGLASRFQFFCTGAVVYPKPFRRPSSNVVEGWQIVLVFQRRQWKMKVLDTVHIQDAEWGAEKGWHPWQQPSQGMAHWIKAFSRQGQLVLDPFCGGGTVPFVCRQLKRRCISCDVDKEAVLNARRRLVEDKGKGAG